jgi:hypothetical protein
MASRPALDMINCCQEGDLMFDSGIPSDIAIGPDQRPVDATLTKKIIIKYLSSFDLSISADFWPDGILEGSYCGLSDPFFLLAKMALLKRAFLCKRAMRDPIPEGIGSAGLELPAPLLKPRSLN